MKWTVVTFVALFCLCTASAADSQYRPGITSREEFSRAQWGRDSSGSPLRMDGYVLTFDDEFNNLDCVEGRPSGSSGSHKWYSYGAFGKASFTSCSSPQTPFSVSGGTLGITISKEGGHWQSGELAALSPTGDGFAQKYGVFEARIKLPAAVPNDLAVWPSFWLLSRYVRPGNDYTYTELDLFEVFGKLQGPLYTTFHEWPGKNPGPGDLSEHRAKSIKTNLPIFDGQWHTYGLKWNKNWYIVYRDERELYRVAMQGSEMEIPMYPIVDLALHDAPAADVSAKYTMFVDWIRVYNCQDSEKC